MRIDTYKCDRCAAEAKPEGVPKIPQDWARLSIELPWAQDQDRWVKRDLCPSCKADVLHFLHPTERSTP